MFVVLSRLVALPVASVRIVCVAGGFDRCRRVAVRYVWVSCGARLSGSVRRVRAVGMLVIHCPSPLSRRSEDRTDQRQKEIVNLSGREPAPRIDPPVQHENERANDVLRQQVSRDRETIRPGQS